MKKTLLTLSLLLFSILTFAQAFEGEIIYHNTYTSKLPSVTGAQFTGMMGDTQDYWVKGANYRSNLNGTLIQWQLYIPKDKKIYSKMSNSKAILWNDVTVNDDQILSTELHKQAVTILGYLCDELVLKCKSGVQKYYFSSKLPVDSKLYAEHAYGNWYAYLSKANALPLKMVIDNAQFIMESTAVAVKPGKVEASLFALPAGTATAKSPY